MSYFQDVGGIVFQLGSKELSEQKHLADFEIERRQVILTDKEQIHYDQYYSQFISNLKRLGFNIPSMHNLKRLIMMSNKNKIAREELLAKNKASEIALNQLSSKYPDNLLIGKLYMISKEKINRIQKNLVGVQKFTQACDILEKNKIPESSHADLLSQLNYDFIWKDLEPNNAMMTKKIL